jgi:hypothetical protein
MYRVNCLVARPNTRMTGNRAEWFRYLALHFPLYDRGPGWHHGEALEESGIRYDGGYAAPGLTRHR